MHPELERITGFLTGIGLTVRRATIEGRMVLPGLTIDHGNLVIDEAALAFVGDVLHEAGHLAVTPAAERADLSVDAGPDGGAEIGAIAWSFAAATHLGLDPALVFHDAGYRGGAGALINNFTAGRYIGVPILAWRGLTTEQSYPAMTRWLAA